MVRKLFFGYRRLELLVVFCLLATLTSCAIKTINKEEAMKLESIQKIGNIYKEVKTYDYNPQYTLHIGTAANFTFELLVNDFPIVISYDPGILTGSMPINHAILKRGVQTIKFRMTPPVDDEFNMAAEIDLSTVELRFRIVYGDFSQQKVKDFTEVFQYEMPKMEGVVPYFEIDLAFEAPIVPYEEDIEGWLDGVDLSEEDEETLLQEVEAFYRKMIDLYEKKDIASLAPMKYKRQFEMAQSYYQNQEYKSQGVVDRLIDEQNEVDPFIFFDYAMKFYGNGKMVRLVKTDKYYLNMSALMRENNDTAKYTAYIMFLHRPKPGAPLEVIR